MESGTRENELKKQFSKEKELEKGECVRRDANSVATTIQPNHTKKNCNPPRKVLRMLNYSNFDYILVCLTVIVHTKAYSIRTNGKRVRVYAMIEYSHLW